ncbi:MAG: M6 family metalloprotease domain-containing protein [candidate division WOR-3 bacterium]
MILIALILLAMPPYPYGRAVIKPPKFPALMNRGPGRIEPAVGERKAIVLLIDFSDNPHQYDASKFDSLIYGESINSMRKYYSEVSYGKFTISKESNIEGWFLAPQLYSYYVGDSFGFYSDYPNNVQKLVEDACALADPYVDFSQYDGDGDGIVDGIFIVHAGPGAEETGDIHDIWSHQWQLSNTGTSCPGPYQTQDGVKVDYYSMEPERFEVVATAPITCGVFCHEFGHVLGLPDLYDIDYSTYGIGSFCIMSAGSWGQAGSSDLPGNTPCHFSAWCKYQLGWLNPTGVSRSEVSRLDNQQIPCSAGNPYVIRMGEDPGGPDWNWSGGKGEYFLIENRYRTGFDRSLPGDGLLILHIDDSQEDNSNENHPLVGIMQADGDKDYLLSNWGSASDLWKDDSIGFYDGSVPSSRFYGDSASGVTVYNIGKADSVMTASFWISPVFLGTIKALPNPFKINRPPSWGNAVAITYTPSDTTELGSQFPEFKVTIFNIAGERVRVLDDPSEIDRWRRTAFWNLKNEKNQDVVSGMYLYIIEIQGDHIERRKGKMTIIR